MSIEKRLIIANNLDEVSVLAVFVENLCEELDLSAETTMNINLALEEAIANIIMYAYPSEEKHDIILDVKSVPGQLVFLLTDKGGAFDPTQVSDAEINAPIEERAIGGLGIFLIRNIMNEVSYQRLDGENLLIMKKNI